MEGERRPRRRGTWEGQAGAEENRVAGWRGECGEVGVGSPRQELGKELKERRYRREEAEPRAGSRSGRRGRGAREGEGARRGAAGARGRRPATHLRRPCRGASSQGQLAAGGDPGPGAGARRRPGRGAGRGAALRTAPAAALALPPDGQRGLASRACPQGPPPPAGLGPRHLHRGRWGGEVRTPRPAPRTGPAHPHARVGRRQGASGHARPTAPDASLIGRQRAT